jgi:hypothetical protein
LLVRKSGGFVMATALFLVFLDKGIPIQRYLLSLNWSDAGNAFSTTLPRNIEPL